MWNIIVLFERSRQKAGSVFEALTAASQMEISCIGPTFGRDNAISVGILIIMEIFCATADG